MPAKKFRQVFNRKQINVKRIESLPGCGFESDVVRLCVGRVDDEPSSGLDDFRRRRNESLGLGHVLDHVDRSNQGKLPGLRTGGILFDRAGEHLQAELFACVTGRLGRNLDSRSIPSKTFQHRGEVSASAADIQQTPVGHGLFNQGNGPLIHRHDPAKFAAVAAQKKVIVLPVKLRQLVRIQPRRIEHQSAAAATAQHELARIGMFRIRRAMHELALFATADRTRLIVQADHGRR